MNPNSFSDWLFSAKPGDRITYYVGYLAKDREDNEVNLLANLVWAHFELGRISLRQRMISQAQHRFSYTAVRR